MALTQATAVADAWWKETSRPIQDRQPGALADFGSYGWVWCHVLWRLHGAALE